MKGYRTITAAAVAFVAAAVALILHYTEAVVLDPGALSAAWTSGVSALVFGGLRFVTSTRVMSSQSGHVRLLHLGALLPLAVALAYLFGGCALLRDMTPDQRAALAVVTQAAAAANLDALAGEIQATSPEGAAAVLACAPLVDEALSEGIMGNPCAVELARRAVACASGALDGFGLTDWAARVTLWGRVLVADVALVAVLVGHAELALCGADE